MRAFAGGILAALLAGCSASPRDVSIASLDLADGTTLAELQSTLPADDRAALGTYALLHWPKSKFYCGQPIGGGNAVASTVGEAIDQTRAYEKALEVAQAQTRASVAMSAKAEERALIDRLEHLVLERDMLFARMGSAAHDTPRGTAIERQLAEVREELGQVRKRQS